MTPRLSPAVAASLLRVAFAVGAGLALCMAMVVLPWLQLVYLVAGLVVLSEALNKLERTDLFAGRQGAQRALALGWLLVPWHWRRQQVVQALKAFGWALLSVGAAGALVTPFIKPTPADLQDVSTLAGFAVLVVRSRVKEG